MSLFDKLRTTSLKSLKYGNDSFGGGDSLEPIIQKPIRNNNPQGVQTPVQDVAKENEQRISYLLDKTNRGYKFKTTQRQLQLSNTRIESVEGNITSRTRISPLIYYNPENTIAQIGRNPAEQGEHYTRFGITPFMDESSKYISIVSNNNKTNNRLNKLLNKLQVGYLPAEKAAKLKLQTTNNLLSAVNSITGASNYIAGIFNIFGGNSIVNSLNSKLNQIGNTILPALRPKDTIIDEYNGGPGSIYGSVGTTKIRRFDYTNDIQKQNDVLILGNNKVIAKKDLLATTRISNIYGINYNNQTEIKNSVYNITPTTSGGKNFQDIVNKSKGMSSSTHTEYSGSSNNSSGYRYLYTKKLAVDIRKGNQINWINSKLNAYNDDGIDDRMPIRFNLIDAFTGDSKETLSFSAYINGFKDSSNPEYTDIKYIGRSEHFYVYNGFKRDVSFNFQIPCYNPFELREKHKNLATLMSSTMGQYNDTKLGGVLCYLKLGNYVNNQPGFITSLSYDIPNDSSWDIDKQLAYNINVSVGFTLIHNFLPSFNNSGSIFTIGDAIPNRRLADGNPSDELAIAQEVVGSNFTNILNSLNSIGGNKKFQQLSPFDQIKEAKKKQAGNTNISLSPKPLPVTLSAIPKIDIKRPF
jgi:hypothetical protein